MPTSLFMKHTMSGLLPGKKIVFLGAIHGDELCGPVAISSIIKKIERKEIEIVSGSVTFVPIANPEAHSEQKRELKENLNRVFKKTDKPATYEQELANELCALVDEHDVLLDIHSSFVPAPSHVFVDYPTEENMSFARALNTDYMIFDWPKVYEHNPYAFPAWTTDRYAHEAGKIGLLVECGKHDDPIAVQRAEDAIVNTLRHFGQIADTSANSKSVVPASVYMDAIFQRDSAEDRFSKSWSHLDKLLKGDLIATRESGEEIYAEYDGYILFPKEYAKPGGEWFYIAH